MTKKKLPAMSRAEFERRLGGTWKPAGIDPSMRTNGKWLTYRGYSEKVRGRWDCFIRPTNDKRAVSARNWGDLGKRLGFRRKKKVTA